MIKFTLKNTLLILLALTCLYTKVVLAAGDASAGKVIFEEECSECHSIQGKNKKGPTLTAVLGRKAGTVADYSEYSDGMKNSGMVWSEATLDQYLTMPRKFIPGAK